MTTWYYLKSKNSGLGPSSATSGTRPPRIARKDTTDDVNLDFNQDPKAIVGEILKNVSRKEGVTKGRRLAYLNIFVKFLQESKIAPNSSVSKNLGFSVEQICLCLRVCLVHEATVVRMAAMRALRYLIVSEEDLTAMNSTQIPFLIVRSLDIVLNNPGERNERMQAARLCQKILAIPNGANHFPSTVTRALVAVGFDGLIEQDKLHKTSLSILCHLALLNPMHFIENGGVRVLLHNVLAIRSPMVLEAILGSLLHLLNIPETREAAGIDLQCLVAPLTDQYFKHSGYEHPDKDVDERKIGYRCAKTAIGIVLRSWSGIAHFCQSRNSGLQALIDALYMEQREIRETILDLLCEIVGLKFPTWTDEVSVALSAVDLSHPKDSWRLQEGFVVEEALTILPHLALSTPNITANHMGLIIYSFAQKGLLEALVEVIVTNDTFISVRATVLLGELLSLVDRFIPVDCLDPSQCIPSLISYSMGESPRNTSPRSSASSSVFSSTVSTQIKQQRAMEAVTVLSCLQKLKSRPASPNSVFLQTQLSFAGYYTKQHDKKFVDRLGQVQLNRILSKDVESNPTKILRDTNILSSKDPLTWQWETILTLIKWCPSSLRRVEDSSWRTFLRRLVDFFKPSNNLFARVELGKGQSKLFAKVGCALFEFLADLVENFSGTTLLEELLADIATHLDELLRHTKNPYVCFFSPNKLETTLSQTYFLFVGKLSQSPKGFRILEQGNILKRFYDLVGEMQHDCYVKLTISSLCYNFEYCKRILSSALVSPGDSSRLYATQFLRVLVRGRFSGFSHWLIKLLINQLDDSNKAISLTAMDILEEAIHDKMFLESLIAMRPRPTLTHFGDRGLLLLICYLSLPSGFKFLQETNFLKPEIERWQKSFNKRYVELVEVLVRDSVSTLRRGEDGKYPERASRDQEQSKFLDIYVPPHLYGQLAMHKEGLDVLLEVGKIDVLVETVNLKKCSTPEETRELKAALWALGHFATSLDALEILKESNLLESMVSLGATCPVLSVRHTIFHCLCLVASTQAGAESIRKYGWHAMPRNHHESYPIWASSSLPVESPSKYLYPELGLDDEFEDMDDKTSINSKTDSCSNNILEEDADSVRFFMMDEDASIEISSDQVKDEELRVKGSSQPPSSSRKISYVHHRSQSDSQTLGQPANTALNTINNALDSPDSNPPRQNSVDETDSNFLRPSSRASSGTSGSFKLKMSQFFQGRGSGSLGRSSGGSSSLGASIRQYRSGSNGSWKTRKNRQRSVTEPSEPTRGVVGSLGEPSYMDGAKTSQHHYISTSDHVSTLSPIPSSASIATTSFNNPLNMSPSSADYSRMTVTEPGTRSTLGSSPSYAYRSVKMRKPLIRMPILSDSDIYPLYSARRLSGLSSREPKTASLDRHFILSPGDLFSESKLMRVNSSMTSLSTPSFRLRPEAESKVPCFMGLCLPKDFQMIFLTHSSVPLHVRMSSLNAKLTDNSGIVDSDEESKVFQFHSVSNCLGCYYHTNRCSNEIVPAPTIEDSIKCPEYFLMPEGSRNSVLSLGSVVSCTSSVDSNERRKFILDSPEGQNVLRKEILRLVSNMISCVGAKSNEQGLLRLKQKFSSAFQDVCLYSELCSLISKYNVRLPLRRFVQELFLDLKYDVFYKIAAAITGEPDPDISSGENKQECVEDAPVPVVVAVSSPKHLSRKKRFQPSPVPEEPMEKIDEDAAVPSIIPYKNEMQLLNEDNSLLNPPTRVRELGEDTEDELDLSDIIDLK